MEIHIPIGIKLEEKRIVSKEDTAIQYGSGLLAVFATPAMIAFMEHTAYRSVEPLLPEGFGSVGISLNVQHKKATLPGKKVRCISEVTQVEGKRIYFKLIAFDEDGEIGVGEHVRYIVNNKDFMESLR